uniref:Uncharacterized protein n=1 Tax=Rhizophora mucronata TaxID=61149 RepID=A0A2P2R069_RHIMU
MCSNLIIKEINQSYRRLEKVDEFSLAHLLAKRVYNPS